MTVQLYKIKDSLLDEYDYSTDPLLKQKLHAWDRMYIGAMMSYGRTVNNFGRQLMAHQNRVAKDGANLLRHMGYSDKAARNFRAAMLFHDMGKTHSSYSPGIWDLPDRPTPEEKAEQKKHARRGAEMFRSIAENTEDLAYHPHFHVRHAVTLYHHERIDGTGPEGVKASALPRFVQVSCIVDAYDGDRIWRPHQERRRSPEEALLRMMGHDRSGRPLPDSKYLGAFSGSLLYHYIQMKEKELGLALPA